MARRQGPREVYRVAGLVALIKDHQLACSEGCQSHVRRKTAPILMRGVPQSLLCSGAVAKVGEVFSRGGDCVAAVGFRGPMKSAEGNRDEDCKQRPFLSVIVHTDSGVTFPFAEN